MGQGDNKVAEDVLHLNWDTVHFPAQQMLDAGYTVINACWNPLYIVDHYPRTMFTAVPVQGCYDWDIRRFAHVNHGMPTFAKPHVTKTEEGILGYCMPWWEGREENVLALCVAPGRAVPFMGRASNRFPRRAKNNSGDNESSFQRPRSSIAPKPARCDWRRASNQLRSQPSKAALKGKV